ncbi:MAG: sulfatase [Planctomycetaceae bacterium]|nr:sulfatase [Planctomycetaceae bacterium]
MPALRILAGLFVFLLSGNLLRADATRPNFVIFVADDMAWDDCGAYGHPHIRTPQIDRLAQEGMRFDRAYLTCSSCSPSRCSMLTGRYPHSTGAGELHLPLPAEQVLFAAALKDAGYFTTSAGKWHLGPTAKVQLDLVQEGGGPGGEEHWVPTLQNRPRNRPFFCWFAAMDPHRDYKPGAVDPPHTADDVVVPPIFPDTPEVRRDLALYYDEIARFDEAIGAVRAELESQGVLDNTMLLVISDNGRPFPRCKTTVYEDGVRTPFVVRYPALTEPGTVSLQLVSTIDIAPTVLELAGLNALPSLQGRSFVPQLTDPEQGTRDFAFSEHNWHDYRAFERGVTDGHYRLVRDWLPQLPTTPPADAVRSPTYEVMQRQHAAGTLNAAQELVFDAPRSKLELYDIDADPNCLHDLADDPQHADARRRLKQVLDEWQAETDDKFPGEARLTPDGFDRTTGSKLPGMKGAHPGLGAR